MDKAIYKTLKAPQWSCQWTCRGCKEKNLVTKREIPEDITTPKAIIHYLHCRSCGKEVAHPKSVVWFLPAEEALR